MILRAATVALFVVYVVICAGFVVAMVGGLGG